MLIADVCDFDEHTQLINTVCAQCSEFISEAKGNFVYKALPSEYNNIQKVKVRHHVCRTPIDQAFNEAFHENFDGVATRGVVASTRVPISESNTTDVFCVLPVNGYKYIYNKDGATTSTFGDVFSMLNNQSTSGSALKITSDLVRYTYTQDRLNEGLASADEIVFFKIPYYYAVRVRSDSYIDLITTINKKVKGKQ